ncbi:sorting nexin-9/18/33 [Entomortierella parvispora]|uniref:Sorting nexin-9/18/33 n=1 Tax=Entomortierella parvispora TaxID=205924 RepID=A0A9P3LZY8_9FUNG|nr:sorting nexin-9/18/33 [Entomortierella parvispora]
MNGSAPAIPKIHPVFATQPLKTLGSVSDEGELEVEYKDGAFSIDAALPQKQPESGQSGTDQQSPTPSGGNTPQQQPPPHGWTVRALYDFEGQPEFSELSFSAGDVLTVVKVGLAEGWSLAEKDGVKGLVPEAYITYIHDFSASPPGVDQASGNHAQEASTTSAYSSYSTATAIGGGTNPRNSVFGKRQLNRFSWFVTTGVEEFILTGGATATNNASTKNAKPGSADGYSSSTLDAGLSRRTSAVVVPDIYDRSPPTSVGGSVRQPYGPGGSLRSNSGGSGGGVDSKLTDDSEEEEEVTESDKHYVQSGPSWQEKAPLFKVRVHDPETRRKMVGMQEYTLFQVTSTFTQGVSVTVERRYSQFEWLYERLIRKFGALVFPPLPEKQYTGRFSDEFIERRRRALERFLNRLVRHPVLRYSDLVTHFLSCSDDGDWKRAERKFENDKITGTGFFKHVYHPEFNVNEDGDIDLVERFNAHCKGSERLMPFLTDATLAYKEGVSDSQFRYKRFGLALLNLISTTKDGLENQTLNDDLAWCWRENCNECLRLTKALQTTAETMQLMADVHQSHITEGCTLWQDTIKEHATPSTTFAPLVDMHTGTHKKLVEIFEKEQTMEELDSETVKSRCDTVFNITLAEMDRVHDERVEDFQNGTKEFLDSQIAYHEKMLAHLKQARAAFDTPYYDNLSNSPRFRSRYEKDLDDQRYQSQKPSRPVSAASVASVSNMVGGVVDGVGFMNGLLKNKTRTSSGRSIMGFWS